MYVILDAFFRPDRDTTSLTNYGFAIFIGLASVCFGWSRAIKGPQSDIDKIIKTGEEALNAGLIFLAASGLKYLFLNFELLTTIKSIPLLHNTTKSIVNITYMACFAFGYSEGLTVVFKISLIIHQRN